MTNLRRGKVKVLCDYQHKICFFLLVLLERLYYIGKGEHCLSFILHLHLVLLVLASYKFDVYVYMWCSLTCYLLF